MDAQTKQAFEDLKNHIDANINRLRSDVTAWMERLSDNQERAREDMQVNMAASDRVDTKLRNVRNDAETSETRVGVVHRRLIALEARIEQLEGRGTGA